MGFAKCNNAFRPWDSAAVSRGDAQKQQQRQKTVAAVQSINYFFSFQPNPCKNQSLLLTQDETNYLVSHWRFLIQERP